MIELFKSATDDQIALAICFGGVLFSGTVMYFSYHLGRLTNSTRTHDLNRQTELQLRRAFSHRTQPVPEKIQRDRAA